MTRKTQHNWPPDRVNALKRSLGWSNATLAEAVGRTEQTIAKLEQGATARIDFESQLNAVMRAIGTRRIPHKTCEMDPGDDNVPAGVPYAWRRYRLKNGKHVIQIGKVIPSKMGDLFIPENGIRAYPEEIADVLGIFPAPLETILEELVRNH